MTLVATFDEVGLVELNGPTITIRLQGCPDKYHASREEIEWLIQGVKMDESVRLRRRDEGQSVLFGDVSEMPGGTATLTYSKKSIRLALPDDPRMLLITISGLQKLLQRDEQVCPVVQLVYRGYGWGKPDGKLPHNKVEV